MRRNVLSVALVLCLGLVLGPGLILPSPSQAFVEVGAGLASVSFEDDLDAVDTDLGKTLEFNLGSGTMRLMVAFQSSSHDQGDYEAWMLGPSFTLDGGGFTSRIYALLSGHEFENIDGTGVTLGGGIGWPVFPAASLGFDLRVSRWEGDGFDVGTGTLQVLFRLGF